jgi:hypothetical protein
VQQKPLRCLFEGVIQCSFSSILGPAPSAVYPIGFISDEEAKKLAEEAMLLLVVNVREASHTIMSFPASGKLGVVGIYRSPSENMFAVIAVFDEKAGSLLWRGYPLIRNLMLNEAERAMLDDPDVPASLFRDIRELCSCLSEETDVEEVMRFLERSVEKAGEGIRSLIDSGQLEAGGSNSAGLGAVVSGLLTALQKTKLLVGELT